MNRTSHTAADENAMLALGERLVATLPATGVICLQGDLGAGKTTLARGMLRGLGFSGRVKSPTYGLIESYDIAGRQVHHLDLYRLGHPEELAFLGLEDLLAEDCLMLVEWPERGRGWLPACTVDIVIDHGEDEGRLVTVIIPQSTEAGE